MNTAAALSISATNPMRLAVFSFGFQVNKEKRKMEMNKPQDYGVNIFLVMKVSTLNRANIYFI